MAGKMQFCFKRYEKKYMLTPEQYTEMLAGMEDYMRADEYGRYTICNIYYDTVHLPAYQVRLSCYPG